MDTNPLFQALSQQLTQQTLQVPIEQITLFPAILKLNAQFSKFTNANDFSHFMGAFMESLRVELCKRLAFDWFMSSFNLLRSKEIDNALKIAIKVNKEKISNPLMRSRVPLTRKFPKPLKPLKIKPKEVFRPPLNIFEVPDDVLSKIFS